MGSATLTSSAFNLENAGSNGCWDYIDIKDANGDLIETRCGTSFADMVIPGDSFIINLKTDGSVRRSGFSISYGEGSGG